MVLITRNTEFGDPLVNLCAVTDSYFDHQSLEDPEKTFVVSRVFLL